MFFIRDSEGRENGPYPIATLASWIEEGRCTLFTSARREDQKRWRVLGAFTEFARVHPCSRTGESNKTATPQPVSAARNDPATTDTSVVSPPPVPPPVFFPPAPASAPDYRNKKTPPPRAKTIPPPTTLPRPPRVAVTVHTEPEEEGFSLPGWAWKIWLVCVAIWFFNALLNGFRGANLISAVAFGLLMPLVAAYAIWKNAEQNKSLAGALFLIVFLLVFLSSCNG